MMMMMMMMSRKPRGSGYRSPMDGWMWIPRYLHDDLGDFFIHLIMWTCYVML